MVLITPAISPDSLVLIASRMTSSKVCPTKPSFIFISLTKSNLSLNLDSLYNSLQRISIVFFKLDISENVQAFANTLSLITSLFIYNTFISS